MVGVLKWLSAFARGCAILGSQFGHSFNRYLLSTDHVPSGCFGHLQREPCLRSISQEHGQEVDRRAQEEAPPWVVTRPAYLAAILIIWARPRGAHQPEQHFCPVCWIMTSFRVLCLSNRLPAPSSLSGDNSVCSRFTCRQVPSKPHSPHVLKLNSFLLPSPIFLKVSSSLLTQRA